MRRISALSFVLAVLSGCMVLSPPAWSPDGRYVACIKYTPSGDTLRARLIVFDMNEGDLQRPSLPRPAQIVWGPAGLYVTAMEGQGARIYLLEPPAFDPQEIALPDGAVYWAVPVPDGSGLCYCRSGNSGGMRLAYFPYAEAEEKTLADGACLAAFSSDGGTLFAGGWKDAKPVVMKFDYRGGAFSGPLDTTVLPEFNKVAEATAVPVPYEGGLVCWLPGHNSIWVLPKGGGPANRIGVPGLVRYASVPSGGGQVRMVLEMNRRGARYAPAVLDLKSGKTSLEGPTADRPYGFGAWNPAGTVYAEVSRGGLKLEPVTGDWVRYFPENPAEKLVAAEALWKQSPLEAIYFLSEEPEGLDGFRWYLVKAQAAAANDEARASARAFLKGFLCYPVTGMDKGVIQARMKDLPLGMDEAAVKAADLVGAEDDDALNILGELEGMTASEDLLAGVEFRKGFIHFRKADFHSAARAFEKAARSDLFPQADYAAVLAMVSYHLEGRQDMAGDMAAMVRDRYIRRRASVSLAGLQGRLDKWAARPARRELPLFAGVSLVVTEQADYLLRLSLDENNPVQVDRIARMRLAVVTQTPNDPTKDVQRRELTDMPGAFAGFAKRGDGRAFAVAGLSGRDVTVVVGKMPGVKMAARTYRNAVNLEPKGDETLNVSFSPSGKTVDLKGLGFKGEVVLSETRKDRK